MVAMPSPIPAAVQGQKYILLKTFRKNGQAVATPVWFGEEDDKPFVMTRSTSGKYKRIRNNPQVRVAPCTIRGVVTGPEFAAIARILRLGIIRVRAGPSIASTGRRGFHSCGGAPMLTWR
jgi:PPOX class probable F420-dependent enzyme